MFTDSTVEDGKGPSQVRYVYNRLVGFQVWSVDVYSLSGAESWYFTTTELYVLPDQTVSI